MPIGNLSTQYALASVSMGENPNNNNRLKVLKKSIEQAAAIKFAANSIGILTSPFVIWR